MIRKVLVILVLCISIILFLIFLATKNNERKTMGTMSPEGLFQKEISGEKDPVIQKKILRSAMTKLGPETSLKILAAHFKNGMVEGHGWAHLFGAVLFEKYGIKGMLYCTLDFDYGCYHGFFSDAIPSEGIGVIKQADKLCIEKFGKEGFGCQHGIGHGVLEFYGARDINKALESCSTLTFKGKIFGCQDGIFMDYNFPLSDSHDMLMVTKRDFNKERVYEPCDIVDEKYLETCYYSYPQWALSVFHDDYGKVVELCSKVPVEDGKIACLLGIGGSVVINSDYNPKKSSEICRSFDNSKSRLLCMTAAAWVIYAALPDGEEKSLQVCQSLKDGSEIEYCRRNFNLYEIYGIRKSRVEALPN